MKKRNRKHEKRVKKLIVICILSAIILTASTYAWFIGMQTVNVNAFEINIAAANGLALSIDGVNYADSVTINEEVQKTLDGVGDEDGTYKTNTNSWTSLQPISTVGQMDETYSRMVIYEKSSLTATAGGYRLMSERLNNVTREADAAGKSPEAPGYVVFDLFVKNSSGEAYYTESKPQNEEAIYLTRESQVKVGSSGVEATGIENSVRVAFTQIGRAKSDADAETVQSIECKNVYVANAENKGGYDVDNSSPTGSDGYKENTSGAGTHDRQITNICRNATIWEPNDKAHVQNAIKWYNDSCKHRDGDDTLSDESYTDADCGVITDGGTYLDTYAVNKVINSETLVDVYDGANYNGYTETTGSDKELFNVDTLTDSEKLQEGVERPAFMTLAPNSITKVRVYVYIEGQDVDNYDFASLGKQISIEFGFTKEQFYGEDVDYDNNPELPSQLYRNDTPTYAAAGEVKDYPTGVTYSDGVFTIPKHLNLSTFEFKDGETSKVATLSISNIDGATVRTWNFADKQNG